jgi:F-type H+-transporting ATPase subunit epsilon
MSKQFVVEVYTDKGKVLEKSTSFLELPGMTGNIGIGYDHTPSLLECTTGEMVLKTTNNTHSYVIPKGSIAHVLKDKVTVLTHFLEAVENIDKQRAKEAKERAEKRINEVQNQMGGTNGTSINLERAKQSLFRAELRLEIIARSPIK